MPAAKAVQPWWRRVELPTWGLAVAIYGGWIALTLNASHLPWWFVAAGGGWLVAWHGSLQHEAIHGHPTRSPRINAAIAGPPLSLWLPYGVYRELHTAHHRAERLTDPSADPESNYVSRARWDRSGAIVRALLWVRATLVGRLVLGPPCQVARLAADEVGRIVRKDLTHLRHWLVHALAAGAIAVWVVAICGMSLGTYLLAFVYPGTALTLIRSYAEHRPSAEPRHRTAVVDRAPILGLLFLHNNLHVVHHDAPGLPWYDLPRRYRRDRDRILAGNGGYRFGGYARLFWRHALRPIDAPLHPEEREHRAGEALPGLIRGRERRDPAVSLRQ